MNAGKIAISILVATVFLVGAVALWLAVGGTWNYEVLGLPGEVVYFGLLGVTVAVSAVCTLVVAKLVWGFDFSASSR